MNFLTVFKKILHISVVASMAIVVTVTAADADLIGYWEFDGNTNDSSGNDNAGTQHGYPFYTDGACGQAVSLDGEDDYIETPDITSVFDLRELDSSPWALLFWAKSSVPDQNDPDYPFIFSQSAADHEAGILLQNNYIRYLLYEGETEEVVVSHSFPEWYDYQEWHHYALTKDGDNKVRLYVDGFYKSIGGPTQGVDNTISTLSIGGQFTSVERFWNGIIDEVRIYTTALSQSDIQAIMDECEPEHTTTTVPTQASKDIIRLSLGTLNGQPIDPNDPHIAVTVSTQITGTVKLNVSNSHTPRTVVPVCATPTWGDRTSLYWLIDKWAPVGDTPYYVDVDLPVPNSEGTSYILFGSSGEIDCEDVLSNTNWGYDQGKPVWNDGNDFVDFKEAILSSAIQNGWVATPKLTSRDFALTRVGANAIKVTVTGDYPTTSTTSPYLTLIKGTVKDRYPQPPVYPELIAGAAVSCGGDPVFTDADGKYELYQRPGTWIMKVKLDSYVTHYEDITINESDTIIDDQDFSIIPLVDVTGTVMDKETELPIPEAHVQIGGEADESDQNGIYNLAPKPGAWFIEVTAPGYPPLYALYLAPDGKRKVTNDFPISKSGVMGLIGGTVTNLSSLAPIEWVEISTDGGGLTYSDIWGEYKLYQTPGKWNMEADCDGYASHYEPITVEQGGQNQIIDIELSPVATSTTSTVDPNLTTTTSTINPNVTTTTSIPCPSEQIYGEHSEQIKLVREFRDKVLSKSPEGQEIIRLYYQWSPVIVMVMDGDEDFKEEVKEMVDGVLLLIMGEEE